MTEHYFSSSPGADSRPRTVRFRLDGRDLEMASDRSVFSADRLDPGTRVLLTEAPRARGGVLLDLGCGYGAIACVNALRAPSAQVWAVDVNERALWLAAGNAEAWGVADRVHVCLPDGVPGGVTFDEIWSNPPIRIGKQALHSLLLTWLPRLAPGGRAVLVVGKNLGADSLQRWLGEQGWPTRRLASAKGFRVLESRRAGDPGADS